MYTFYLGDMQLPIPPAKLTVKVKGRNDVVTLVNEGDMSFLKRPGLTEITFDMVIPMLGQYTFASTFQQPDYYLSILESLISGREPFRFIVTRTSPSGDLLFDTNLEVSLCDYNIVEDATKGFDMVVSVSLKQYISYTTQTVTVISAVEATETTEAVEEIITIETPRETSNAPTNTSGYTVVTGDSLWAIAQRYYGNGSSYPKIYEANKDIISSPNLIYPGQVLTIP